ncbi:MAG: hypothetical protein WKG07_29290 [Hymenobacter sp.]
MYVLTVAAAVLAFTPLLYRLLAGRDAVRLWRAPRLTRRYVPRVTHGGEPFPSLSSSVPTAALATAFSALGADFARTAGSRAPG